jgi:beta-lactamase regulating signal transducer with metallopeptidase domain
VIFAARGMMVSLAFFAVIYCFLSLVLVVAWQALSRIADAVPRSSNALFWLRVFPFVFSSTVGLFLAFPSFLLMEAHSMDEDLGTFVLCFCALVLLGTGLFRVLKAHVETKRAVSQWLECNHPEKRTAAIPVPQNLLPIMLVGIGKPAVLVSHTARTLLTDGEIQVAIRHEIGHLRSRDNLKKAILNFLPFPGMAHLERSWREAAELDADVRAVSNRKEALDLASALVKLSRNLPPPVVPAFVTGLIGVAESVAIRVERLLEWKSNSRAVHYGRYWIPLAFAAAVMLAVNLGSALVVTHSLTERLVP